MLKPTQTQAQTHSNPFQALLDMVKPTQTQPKPTPNPPYTQHKPTQTHLSPAETPCKHGQTHPDPQTHSNPVQALLNMVKPIQTHPNPC